MSDATPFGFGKFVPGFDFLQGLAKSSGGGIPHMPQLASWVAPTLNEEDLEKRIEELKAVQFWLDQNSRALTATVQALEVQKMTLATLKGMNVHMTDVAKAFQMPGVASTPPSPQAFAPAAQAAPAAPQYTEPARPAAERADADQGAPTADADADAAPADGAGTGIVDPMQWWGSLTHQFQQIAAAALKDAAAQTVPGSQDSKSGSRAATAKKSTAGSAAQGKPAAQKAATRSKPAAKTGASAKTSAARSSSAARKRGS